MRRRARSDFPLPPPEPDLCASIQVVARPGESGERLIRRFTRVVRDGGVLQEFGRRGRGYTSPSEERRRARTKKTRPKKLITI